MDTSVAEYSMMGNKRRGCCFKFIKLVEFQERIEYEMIGGVCYVRKAVQSSVHIGGQLFKVFPEFFPIFFNLSRHLLDAFLMALWAREAIQKVEHDENSFKVIAHVSQVSLSQNRGRINSKTESAQMVDTCSSILRICF